MGRKSSAKSPAPPAAAESVVGRVPDPAKSDPASAAPVKPVAAVSDRRNPETKNDRRSETAATVARPSSLLDTRVIYCGDNLDQLASFPDACVDLVYLDPRVQQITHNVLQKAGCKPAAP